MHKYGNDNLRSLFIGIDKKIPILGGTEVIPINFDNAATTPVFKKVLERIEDSCECYGSIGRGAGQKSELSTKIYKDCRTFILDFFKATEDKYTAIFVNNTTDGINRLSNILIESTEDVLITTRMEHHSNDLPWRGKCKIDYVEVDEEGRLILAEFEDKLKMYSGKVKYVSVTAASNVTGYINDLKKIARIVHKYGAKLIVDGAQIVAHRKIEIEGDTPDEAIDFFVFSAHKMYAPFGTGVIIGLKEIFEKNSTDLKGGGGVKAVFDNDEILLSTPEKNEVGTPNFFGVIALEEALKQLDEIGYDNIEKNEELLLKTTLDGMKSISKVKNYGDLVNLNDRLGIIVFNIEGIYDEEIAKMLAQFKGIAVRQGAFCAHPYVKRLLKMSDEEAYRYLRDSKYKMPGMVRASFGVYNTVEEVNIFLNTLEWICKL